MSDANVQTEICVTSTYGRRGYMIGIVEMGRNDIIYTPEYGAPSERYATGVAHPHSRSILR